MEELADLVLLQFQPPAPELSGLVLPYEPSHVGYRHLLSLEVVLPQILYPHLRLRVEEPDTVLRFLLYLPLLEQPLLLQGFIVVHPDPSQSFEKTPQKDSQTGFGLLRQPKLFANRYFAEQGQLLFQEVDFVVLAVEVRVDPADVVRLFVEFLEQLQQGEYFVRVLCRLQLIDHLFQVGPQLFLEHLLVAVKQTHEYPMAEQSHLFVPALGVDEELWKKYSELPFSEVLHHCPELFLYLPEDDLVLVDRLLNQPVKEVERFPVLRFLLQPGELVLALEPADGDLHFLVVVLRDVVAHEASAVPEVDVLVFVELERVLDVLRRVQIHLVGDPIEVVREERLYLWLAARGEE